MNKIKKGDFDSTYFKNYSKLILWKKEEKFNLEMEDTQKFSCHLILKL